MKVLLMPSWYPNTQNPSGSFFIEQARFLKSQGVEIKVLIAQFSHTKSYVYHKLKHLKKGMSFDITTSYLEQNPEAYSFPIIIQKSWTDQKKFDETNKAYLNAFEQLIKIGWLPDVIHVQGAFKAGFSAKYISDIYNIPYVVIEHSPFRIISHTDFHQLKILETLNSAFKVAGVSNYQKRRMVEDGVNRQVEVVWNLMDEQKFELKKDLRSSKFVIVCIARAVKVKDMSTFFKAVKKFISRLNDRSSTEVIVVGHHALTEVELNKMCHFNELDDTQSIMDVCTFIPFLERDKIEALLQRASVFVSTSIDEPYGVAIREAMLCGTPVISTRSGGPEDSITDDTGVLVNIGDYEAIATYLNKIYKSLLIFDYSYIRNYIINQSGRAAFKKRMDYFYKI